MHRSHAAEHAAPRTSEGTPGRGESRYHQSLLPVTQNVEPVCLLAQIELWNERSGRGPVPDRAGSPGGGGAAGDGSRHQHTGQPSDTTGYGGQIPVDFIAFKMKLSFFLFSCDQIFS